MCRFLRWLFRCCRHHKIVISFTINLRGPQMANVSLIDTQQISITANFTDTEGNAVLVAAAPTVTVSDATLLAVAYTAPTEPANSISFIVSAIGPLGSATFTVTVINPDGTQVTVTQGIAITNGNCSAITLVMGTPTAIVAPAPAA